MSTYRKIHGRSIQAVTTDPSETVAEGQIWYNTNSDTFKTVLITEAYSSGAPVATARRGMSSSKNGTQDAMFGAGGYAAGPSTVASTEEYNGSGFSTGGNLNNARYAGTGAGTLTAGLAIGSAPDRTLVEEYDGTSWTAGGAMSTGRGAYDMGCGTQTAAMTAGGFLPPNAANTNATEHYNGSSWTGSGNLTDSRRNHSGCGIQTAAVTFAGDLGPSTTNQVQNYDGSSWTNVTTTPATIVQYMAFGTQTNSVYAGGSPPTTATSFKYDGTSISSGPAMATGRAGAANAGSGTAGIVASGMTTNPTTFTDNTEEFTSSVNIITAAAWSSGTAINTARNSFSGFGLQTANIIAGGYGSPNVKNETEEWDGTSWSEKNNLSTARSHYGGSQASPYTAAVIFKGNTSASDTSTNATEEWDGTNWTSGNTNPTTGQRNMGAGTQTAALSFGGIQNPAPPAPRVATSQEYDGTNWTSGGTMNTARNDGGGTGTQTAGLGYGGDTPGATAATEEYNGTAWTSVNNMVIASGYYGECGQSQTDAMAVGNLYASPDNGCQHYDGTNWSTRPLLGTARFDSAGSGTGTAAMVAGGGTPGNTDVVEEFTGATTAVNVKTLTQS